MSQFLGFALLLAVVIPILVWAARAAAKRRQELAAWAASRGFVFRHQEDPGMEGRYPGFPCMQQGSRRYAFNLIDGERAGRQLRAFDYHYETYSHGKHGRRTHHHHFSAVILETGLPLKPLAIRPEGFLDKIGEFFGIDDIDFESAEFSRKFHVKAPDRKWAFDVLHQETMEFLLGAPQFRIEFAGPHAIAYRTSRFPPAEFDAALSVAEGILDRLPKYLLKEWGKA